jgi:hypothetical protein
MDIADSFTGLDSAIVISDMIQKELQLNLKPLQIGSIVFWNKAIQHFITGI